jgi:hypothetical protein
MAYKPVAADVRVRVALVPEPAPAAGGGGLPLPPLLPPLPPPGPAQGPLLHPGTVLILHSEAPIQHGMPALKVTVSRDGFGF